VIETQQGGKSEIRSCDRVFVGISGIGFSTSPLTRGRTLHIRSTEIAKHEGNCGSAFRHFDKSGFGNLGVIVTQG
jgi:hypothetical protein